MTLSKPNWLSSSTFAACLLAVVTLRGQDASPAPQSADSKANAATNQVLEDAAATTNAEPAEPEAEGSTGRRGKGAHHDAIVSTGKDVIVKAGDTADDVVVIFGSATIHGQVQGDVVAVFGNLTIDGEVKGDAVAVMGGITLKPTGHIHHDAVAVGEKVDVADGAKVDGQIESIGLGGLNLGWMRGWVTQCLFKLRPLAPQVGWVWAVAGIFFLLYVLTAAVFPAPVRACVQELTERPATTFLIGLLSKILLPLVFLILIVTGIGVFVVPFVIAALIFGLIVGKTAILEALGLRIGQQFGAAALQKPLAGLLLGAIIIAIFYMVPVLGLLTFGIVSIWGLGSAVRASFAGLRRESPKKRPPAAAPVPEPAMAMAGVAPTGNPGPSTLGFEPPSSSSEPSPLNPEPSGAAPLTAAAPPMLPEPLSYPKAGFWERMAAGFLDIVLLGFLGAAARQGPPLPFLIALAYFSAMWTWKGTTIGGIILGLKVVREDGQHVSFLVALIRGLAAAFSIIMLFLGFLWIAWDREKQGWHDKIAGTVVLRLPRGTPLVCL
jgi:uncharacterized RDD family membrane protein YckC